MPAAAKPPNQLPLWLITLALIGAAAVTLMTSQGTGTSAIPYSQFQQLLNEGKVTKVVVSGDTLRGTLSEKLPDGNDNFTTVQVPVDLAGDLSKHHVEFSATAGAGAFATLLSWVLPPLLFVGIWMFASRAMSGRGGASGGFGGFGGGLLSVGRSRAKLVAETDVKVSFADGAGVRRGEGRTARDRRFPEETSRRVCPAGRLHPARHPAGRPAQHRQERCLPARWPARPACRSIPPTAQSSSKCSSASAQPACATCSSKREDLAVHHLHRRAGRAGPCPWCHRTAGGAWTRRSRRLIQLLAEMDGFDRSVGDRSSWRRPTAREILRSGAAAATLRGDSTARCWWIGRTRRGASISCASI